MKKFCTRCGKPFESVGREVICPACKQAAAEESKKAAVLKAKRASWSGESVPVRISGRSSTLIREYGAANNLPFAQALDELLKASTFFQSAGKAWEDITPYKSHRRDKHVTEDASTTKNKQDASQDVPQDAQEVKQDAPQEVKAAQTAKEVKQEAQAAKVASKAVKATSKAVKAATGKAAGKAGKKA